MNQPNKKHHHHGKGRPNHRETSSVQDIHAPYHFVPLSKWVYMPDWAHLVSHDHPFKDGLSGSIDYTLTNATPLLVGAEQENGLVKWARTPDGTPVIPGSSLKGMLRSVMEIATFGKFSGIDDARFAYRDISNSETKYALELQETKVQPCWLKYDAKAKQWTLRKCQYAVMFDDEFSSYVGVEIKNDPKQTALEKYKKWPLKNDAISFQLEQRNMTGTKNKPVDVIRAKPLKDGDKKGIPVFSGFRPGSIDHRFKRLGFNFIFFDMESQCTFNEHTNVLAKELFENHNEELVNYLKKNSHPEFGIPAFARVDKTNARVVAFGFAQMPKKSYEKSIFQLACEFQNAANNELIFDFPELMFGTLRDKALGLKSRVFFSDANCSVNKGIDQTNSLIQGMPKASYLPAYLEQSRDNRNQTNQLAEYRHGSKLSGWKRYPAKPFNIPELPFNLRKKVNVQSRMEIIKPKSQFKGKIAFHNLKPEELGALLWVIKFEREGTELFHSLGHGKAYGAGQVRFEIEALNLRDPETNYDAQKLTTLFEDHMNAVYPGRTENTWIDSPQMRHLLSFSSIKNATGKNLTYMELQNNDKSMTTYTSSVKGRNKQVLPLWREHDTTLDRNEALDVQTDINKFAQGRLFGLLTHKKKMGTLSETEQHMLEDKIQQEEKDVFEQLSENHREYLRLKEQLTPFEGKDGDIAKQARQSLNGDLEKLLDKCIENSEQESFIREFILMLTNTKKTAFLDLATNKKNKITKANRNAKIQALKDKYQLEAKDL